MKKRIFIALSLLSICFHALFLTLRHPETTQKEAFTLSDYKLNTYVSVTIYDPDKKNVLKECMALCDQYELIFSRTDKDSELYQLNNGLLPRSADGYYTVSTDLYEVIAVGKEYAALSDNAFSIAVEPLTSLWDFTVRNHAIPAQSDLDAALPLVNSEDILLKAPDQVAFSKEGIIYTDGSPVNHGMGLDLGAIAKGYIADQLKEYLLSQDVDSAIIYLGGNVLCIGNKIVENPSSNGEHKVEAFTVGIEKPFSTAGQAVAKIKVEDTSVVTSGTYQRYFEEDGTIYHHILDSRSGYPYQNGLVSVTIVTASSTDADALSTTCFSLGLEKGLALLESLEDADGFFITEDGEYHYTEGFSEKYQMEILK